MAEYSEIIASYAENPSNKLEMKDCNISYKEESRSCWDNITIYLKIIDNKIIDYSFTWDTSIVTTASASIFWESIIWQNIQDILSLNYEYMIELIWEVSPRRKQVANLALLATKNAIHTYLKDWKIDDFSDVLE